MFALPNDERSCHINGNRKYLSAVTDVIKFPAACKNVGTIGGHNESRDRIHRGNFLDLMHLIENYNHASAQLVSSLLISSVM